MLRYVFLYLDLQKCLVFLLQIFCCFRVEIRNELANGCKLTNNQIRGWMLSEFRYLVAPPHYIGHTTGQNSQHKISCMDIKTYIQDTRQKINQREWCNFSVCNLPLFPSTFWGSDWTNLHFLSHIFGIHAPFKGFLGLKSLLG